MKILRQGDRGPEVKMLQQRLNLVADGIFGPLTHESVIQFQTVHRLKIDGIVGTATWAALSGEQAYNSRTIKKIIIHCTATPEGEDYSVEAIRQMHIARGFSDIGYHWLIARDGTIYKGRDEAVSGAHTIGHNYDSIGMSYVGGCPPRSVPGWNHKGKDTRTPAQKAAIVKIVSQLKSRYPSATVHGHNEFAKKLCPCFDVSKEIF